MDRKCHQCRQRPFVDFARTVGNEKEDIVMRKHGFRSIFSLLVALVMVCSLLPTAAFAEGNLEPANQVTEQPTNQPEGGEVQQPTEKKEDAPQGEQPASPPQTYTVVYADGAENTVFEAKNFPNLTSGAPTPPFGDDPVRGGYTFRGWEPALAKTVTGDVTYTAKWEAVQMEPQPTEPQPTETQPTEPQNSEQTGTVASTQNAEPNNARIALMAPRPQSTYIVLKATDVNPTGARVRRDTSLGGGVPLKALRIVAAHKPERLRSRSKWRGAEPSDFLNRMKSGRESSPGRISLFD